MVNYNKIKTPYAYNHELSKPVHITQIEKGSVGNYKCLTCKETLTPILGQKRTKHFRHQTNCTGSFITDLHYLIESIIISNSRINIPGLGYVDYAEPHVNVKLGNRTPDIKALYNSSHLYFEIGVTSFVKGDREIFYNLGQHKCIEIDAGQWYVNQPSLEVIEWEVIHNPKIKKLFGWSMQENIPFEQEKQVLDKNAKSAKTIQESIAQAIFGTIVPLLTILVILLFILQGKKPKLSK